ncbi:hypothetical protein ACQKKX_10795 [Neorhizobium sp. NPDC001467]|uniref:hypothetical protein n=1 Tax=Neorhizobium sp. NPDC001467 TaxID=3390595 RepID=UPI003D058C1E
MNRPEDEHSLQDKTEPPAARAQKAKMGRGFVFFLAAFAIAAFCLYLFIAVYGVSTSQ